jgi:hypothetical protein
VVTYTAVFTDNDLGHDFEDAAKLWEDDSGFLGSDDDPITSYPNPSSFSATSHKVDRIIEIILPSEQVSTEIGNEEIKAQIWLRRIGDRAAADEQYTDIIEVNA